VKSKGLWGRKYLDIQERETKLAPPDEDHVIVRIKACGVCGTDLNFVRDWEGDPMPLGHEISAEVIEVGKNVTSVKPGDSVIVEDCTMCGICDNCKAGHPEFCRNLINMEGQPGMGEFMSVRFNSLVKFEGLDYVSACLTEPLAVSLTAVLGAEIPLGGSVVVLGPGPLGLMAARVAKLRGAGFVGMTGLPADSPREKARQELAAKFGCDLFVETGRQDVAEEIKKRFPDGVDRVIVSSPPESIYDALKIVRFGGQVNFFGLHFGGKSSIQIDINDLVFRKITLKPTFAEPAINFPVSNRLLRDGLVDARALISHTFSLEDARSLMTSAVEGTEPVIKAVMVTE
jgi:threonine dehydrogenase-like Zn-dependent dehydrogenase